jgi:hypothetical protein
MTGLERLFAVLPEGEYLIKRQALPYQAWRVDVDDLAATHDDLETTLGRIVEMMAERGKTGGTARAATASPPSSA